MVDETAVFPGFTSPRESDHWIDFSKSLKLRFSKIGENSGPELPGLGAPSTPELFAKSRWVALRAAL